MGNRMPQLPEMPAEGEENPFDIVSIAKKRFGVDISPEAQGAAEQSARQQKGLAAVGGGFAQFYAGQAGNPNGAEAFLKGQREQIDDSTTGEFDRKRARVMEYIKGTDEQLDKARKRKVEDTAYEHGGTEYASETDPNSELSRLTRASSAGTGVTAPETSPYSDIEKVSKLLRKPTATQLNPWNDPNSADAKFLAGEHEAAGYGDVGPGVSPRAIQAGGGMRSPAAGRAQSLFKFQTPKGAQLEALTTTASTLAGIDQLGQMLDSAGGDFEGWDPAFLKNAANRAAWYGGKNDAKRSAINAAFSATLANYVKSRSGLAASDTERTFLKEISPESNDPLETKLEKLAAFRDLNENQLQSLMKSYGEYGNLKLPPVEEVRPGADPLAPRYAAPSVLSAPTPGAPKAPRTREQIKAAFQAGEITREAAKEELKAVRNGP